MPMPDLRVPSREAGRDLVKKALYLLKRFQNAMPGELPKETWQKTDMDPFKKKKEERPASSPSQTAGSAGERGRGAGSRRAGHAGEARPRPGTAAWGPRGRGGARVQSPCSGRLLGEQRAGSPLAAQELEPARDSQPATAVGAARRKPAVLQPPLG